MAKVRGCDLSRVGCKYAMKLHAVSVVCSFDNFHRILMRFRNVLCNCAEGILPGYTMKHDICTSYILPSR